MIPAEARNTFPATNNLVYLDAAAVSLISEPVNQAIRSFLDICIQPGSADASRHHLVMDEMRHRAIEEAAILLNAQEEQIALVESTTHGLNIAANAIPLEAGDRILIADTEYLQVSIPWKMKESSVGVELVPVPTGPDGALTAGGARVTESTWEPWATSADPGISTWWWMRFNSWAPARWTFRKRRWIFSWREGTSG